MSRARRGGPRPGRGGGGRPPPAPAGEAPPRRDAPPPPAAALVFHDDALAGAGGAGAAHGGVDLLGVEARGFVVHGGPAGGLLPPGDAADALHVADDVDTHGLPFWRVGPAGRPLALECVA